jgi:hypothetical protein
MSLKAISVAATRWIEQLIDADLPMGVYYLAQGPLHRDQSLRPRKLVKSDSATPGSPGAT